MARKQTTMGQRIRQLREARNMTQEELADYCDVNKSAVSQWERGASEKIKLEPFLKLMQVLDASYEYLLWGDNEAPQGFYKPRAEAHIMKRRA